MKFKIILSLVLILFFILGSLIIYIFFPNSRIYYKIYEENGKYYYIDYYDKWFGGFGPPTDGKVWIEFKDDLAVIDETKAKLNRIYSMRTWKYIDKKGKVVLRLDDYTFQADQFSEGLAAVLSTKYYGYWGYINKNGEFVIEPQFRIACMFKDGFASAYIKEKDDDRKWILINKKGEYIRDLDEPFNCDTYEIDESIVGTKNAIPEQRDQND